jgi:glucose-1-phosphate thymidylyltransferase
MSTHRKGVILAAGRGTRLYPMTLAVNKQLLPIYDKPMIYYPLSLFLHIGIRDILLIVDPSDIVSFKNILGDGSHFGVRLSYEVQIEKRGIADALIISEKFLKGSPSCLILGDNLLHGENFDELLRACHIENKYGATVLGYKVPDPERFGVVTFNKNGVAVSLEEKPKNPTSPYAVPGIYFYDGRATKLAKTLTPSARGELEITDLNRLYMNEGTLKVMPVSENIKYFDTGTYDSLIEASFYVQSEQNKTGKPIANLEGLAYTYGYIDRSILGNSAEKLSKTSYGEHLHALLKKK